MVSKVGASCGVSSFFNPQEVAVVIFTIAAVAISLVGVLFAYGTRHFSPEYMPFAITVLEITSRSSEVLIKVIDKIII